MKKPRTDLAPVGASALTTVTGWDEQSVALLQQTYATELTPLEFALFLKVAALQGLNPFIGEIWPVKYDGRLVPQMGYEGVIRKAVDSGKFRGFTQPVLTVRLSEDGSLQTIPDNLFDAERHELVAVSVAVKHADDAPDAKPEPVTCYYREYVQRRKDGDVSKRWKLAPVSQLTKCARVAACRARGLTKLGSVVIPEEMGHLELTVEPADGPPADQITDGAASLLSADEQRQVRVQEFLEGKVGPYLKTLHPDLERFHDRWQATLNILRARMGVKTLKDLKEEDLPALWDFVKSPMMTKELQQENIIPMPRSE